MFDNMFNGIMGRLRPGCCRLSLNGRIAVKTNDGYKTYNPKTGNVTNCSNFVLDIADDWFMLIPTRTLKPGDIVIINQKPMYVLENKAKNRVEVMSYEDSSIKTVIPERHALLGRKFYGKVVSLIGNGLMGGKGGFFKNMLKRKMMSAMMGGKSDGNGMFDNSNALPFMMMMNGGSMDGLFEGLCDGDEDEDCSDIFNGFEDEEEEEEVEAPTPKTKTAKKTAKKVAKPKRK